MKTGFTFVLVLAGLVGGCDALGLGDDEKDSNVLSSVVLLEEAIVSHHAPRGPFHTEVVLLTVPESFGRIVISSDENGETPFGVDDYLEISAMGEDEILLNFRLQQNNGAGEPIAEQWVMSNVATFSEGLYTVAAQWFNEYAPPGGNASASTAWIVVLKE